MANSTGALVNHEESFAYQVLKLVLGARRREFGYHQAAIELGMKYANFNRRAAKTLRRLAGYVTVRREGRRVFFQANENYVKGTETAELLRVFRATS